MNEFAKLTKQAFENYYNAPFEPAEWGLTDTVGHIMKFLENHDSVDDMTGLREALYTMSLKDWESWYDRYPEHRESIIEPLHREIAEHAK